MSRRLSRILLRMAGLIALAIIHHRWILQHSSASAFSSPSLPLQSMPLKSVQSLRKQFFSFTAQRMPTSDAESTVLSPLALLHPPMDHDQALPVQVSFSRALQLMKASLTRIPHNDPHTQQQQQSSVLKLEVRLSHAVDPLCWLHAHQGHLALDKEPALYFATAAGDLEAAVLGAAVTLSNTTWSMVEKLPRESYLWGGQRFDTSTPPSPEWRAFGTGFWMLPALELRRTQVFGNSTLPKARSSYSLLAHVVQDQDGSYTRSMRHLSSLLGFVTTQTSLPAPPTTLPPILRRSSNYARHGVELDGQELYERGVTAALEAMQNGDSNLTKVVLARRMDLHFSAHSSDSLTALETLKKWKFLTSPGGHLYFLRVDGQEFFGCTPERLFALQADGTVTSEALAGTRPRGSTQADDELLARELMESLKEQEENKIVGRSIQSVFESLSDEIEQDEEGDQFFLRRLLHLQHICQRFSGKLKNKERSVPVLERLLNELHPTPALGGHPKSEALRFIQEFESIGFDRGLYAGPFGYIGKDRAEIVVAIRSGLLARNKGQAPKISVFAGAGLVPGSTVQSEWAETSYKLGVVSSVFPQSPLTLAGYPTANSAWAAAFVEELIRNGVTQFYICPGSRSTPLVVAIAKVVRSSVGLVHAISVHDERGAAFRACGYGRGTGKPAAVITSSGTAVANLYPAVVEASMEGIPIILLTADRPYESRDTGANQAIDQVKIFSDTYIRWFRDILPPDDIVPVSSALSDACHAVQVAQSLRGPVHLNVQFRENLAPEGGPIRNDPRGVSARFDPARFTAGPSFDRWSFGGGNWRQAYGHGARHNLQLSSGAAEIGKLIAHSSRGIIVVANCRSLTAMDNSRDTLALISELAQTIGFPIIAGVQAASLRFQSSAVIPCAEHLLRHPEIKQSLNPDLVIQLGGPIVSTDVTGIIESAAKHGRMQHVLVHPHYPSERHDPAYTVTHSVSSDVDTFLSDLVKFLRSTKVNSSSRLAPVVEIGRMLQKELPRIVTEASREVLGEYNITSGMTEPEVVLALSDSIQSERTPEFGLFLSNSMPVRDAEAFLYPTKGDSGCTLQGVAVNRGASGIDGIISSATGYAESIKMPAHLLIGDVAALHDINSLHGVRSRPSQKDLHSSKSHPLLTIVLNNDGGGIFSFLPISKFGQDVLFDEYFGTPTSSFSFQSVADAFGVSYECTQSSEQFVKAYMRGANSSDPMLIEAIVVPRPVNVDVHKRITAKAIDYVSSLLEPLPNEEQSMEGKVFRRLSGLATKTPSGSKTMVLLHGWMGDSSEWDEAGNRLTSILPPEWNLVAIDLPGHMNAGRSAPRYKGFSRALGIETEGKDFDIDSLAMDTLSSLHASYGIDSIDALVGYSLGGRVAMAMKRLCTTNPVWSIPTLVKEATKLILLGSNPGDLVLADGNGLSSDLLRRRNSDRMERAAKDDLTGQAIETISDRAVLQVPSNATDVMLWSELLDSWYSAPLWGNLRSSGRTYKSMIIKRSAALRKNGYDLASVLRQASPAMSSTDDWRYVVPSATMFVSGKLDTKYTSIGKEWKQVSPELTVAQIPQVGHALLVEAANQTAELIADFILTKTALPPVRRKIVNEQIPRREEEFGSDPFMSTSNGIKKSFSIGYVDFEPFAIEFAKSGDNAPVRGIGWGVNARSDNADPAQTRSGLLLQVSSSDGVSVGIGEVCPLVGLHNETLMEAQEQLEVVSERVASTQVLPMFDPGAVLGLKGYLGTCIRELLDALSIESLCPSVNAAIEMALLSLAAQVESRPLHQALADFASPLPSGGRQAPNLPLNGLLTRGSDQGIVAHGTTRFGSWKVKVGHQDSHVDIQSVLKILRAPGRHLLRADANRSWNISSAASFVSELQQANAELDRIEYIEEPLQKNETDENPWSLEDHVKQLENLYVKTSVKYALDESIADLVVKHNSSFDGIFGELMDSFFPSTRGCAAIILKPSLIGIELSFRLAQNARRVLGLGAVFTSSFETGIGLAYISLIASQSDSVPIAASAGNQYPKYAHGLGTYQLLAGDTLSPGYASYVNNVGEVSVSGLSRALYGLSLDEIRDSKLLPPQALEVQDPRYVSTKSNGDDTSTTTTGILDRDREDPYEASTATSSSGREVQVVASLPLPFSASVACQRFVDLPQLPRWSPWISSVEYLESNQETLWTMTIRGVSFRWTARSTRLPNGIQWESTSGLKNTGVVEFVEQSPLDCLMKVRMTVLAPRILGNLFEGSFLEDFVRNKLMKWSLEMFRDMVKGDLALEEGDIELGDALFGSVQGKASAIEATFWQDEKGGKRD